MNNLPHFQFLLQFRLIAILTLFSLGIISTLVGQDGGSNLAYQIEGPYNDYPGPFYVKTFVNFVVDPGNEWINDASASNRAQATMDYLNSVYNKHGIYFVNSSSDCSGISYQRVFNTISGNLTAILQQIPSASHDNVFDIYVFDDMGPATGVASGVPGDYCQVQGWNEDNIIASESEILAHEVGHCFGLAHIFRDEGEGGCSESSITQCTPSGLLPCNCCGDYVCDSPIVTSNNILIEEDCSNAINFPNLPPEGFRNFMAYASPGKCKDRFTEGQARRMRAYLATAPNIEHIQLKSVTMPGGTLVSPSGNIIIEQGDFTIDTPLEMLPGATIRVKQGATLRIKSTITGACGQMWQGIIVEGSEFETQTNTNQGIVNQGKVVVSSNGIIEHAKCGIYVQNLESNAVPIDETGGGIIAVLGGKLYNNTIGVKFGPYQYFSPTGGLEANKSMFFGADFLITDDYRGGNKQPILLDLNGIVALRVRYCNFKDLRTQNCTSPFSKAIGIDSKNAGLYISYGQFDNLHIGLRADELNIQTGSFSIFGSTFSACYTGIYSKMTSSFSIIRNNFEVKKPDICPSSAGLYIRGVHINGNTSGFTFADNNFFNNDANTPAEYLIGTDCTGLGEGMNNTIFRNTYTGLNVGNRASGYNGEEEEGLLYLCNINQNSNNVETESDFIVEEGGTIKSIQNDHNTAGTTLPTGNQFSHVLYNFQNKNQSHLITYYYNGLESLEDPAGGGGSEGLIPIELFQANSNCIKEDPCPSPCQDGTTVTLWKSEFQQNKQSKLNKEAEYAASTNTIQKEIIGEEITRLQLEMNKDARRILMQYSLDTTIIQLDSLYKWQTLASTYPGDLRLARHYFFTKDFTNFDQLWSFIPVKYGLSGADLLGFNNLGEVYITVRPHLENGTSLGRLPTSTTDSLLFWGNWCSAPGFLAQNLLWRNGINVESNCSGTQSLQKRNNRMTESATLNKEKKRQKIENHIQVFPNPAKESISIVLPDNMGEGEILILDIYGKIVLKRILSDDSTQLLLSVNHLVSGIYFIEIRNKKGKTSRKKVFISQ